MANQRTTKTTTPPSYKKHTTKEGQTTEVSNNNGKVTTKVTQKGGDYAVRVVDGNKTYYKTFDKSGKETTGKSTPVKATESKAATSKLTEEQKSSIPFKNSTIDKFSEKVYPIWQGSGRSYTDTKGVEHTPIITGINKEEQRKASMDKTAMFGTKAQADSSRAVVTGTNIKKTTGGYTLFTSPDKKNPLVKPGNTGAGALVKRTYRQNNEQKKANKILTGNTGDERQ
jgi:hypothetical protein